MFLRVDDIEDRLVSCVDLQQSTAARGGKGKRGCDRLGVILHNEQTAKEALFIQSCPTPPMTRVILMMLV